MEGCGSTEAEALVEPGANLRFDEAPARNFSCFFSFILRIPNIFYYLSFFPVSIYFVENFIFLLVFSAGEFQNASASVLPHPSTGHYHRYCVIDLAVINVSLKQIISISPTSRHYRKAATGCSIPKCREAGVMQKIFT